MKLSVFVVGKLKEKYFQAAEDEYLKRLRPYCKLEIREFKTDMALAAAIPSAAYLVVLDERGKALSSREFAGLIEQEAQFGGGRPVVFAIGGADGHESAMRKRADALFSFGKATIAHRLVRLILLEQIYRAHRINRGEPYHRD